MAKTQSITPTIAEFDDWDETKETEALAEVAKQVKVRHIIKNNEYWALTPGGTVYKLPLYLSIADFEALSGASTDTDSLDQVKRILTVFAGDEQAKQLEREPMQVAFNMGRRSPNRRASNWENRRLLPNPQLRRRSKDTRRLRPIRVERRT